MTYPHCQSSTIYQSLISNNIQARFVTIYPSSNPQEIIKCCLSLDSIDKCKPYRALSYVWGDPIVTHPISVNGIQVNVTTNLAAALRHLRAIGYVDKPWWIDAICINQDDIAEKGHQVRIMADIYQNADEVLAWLGGEESNETLANITGALAATEMAQEEGLYGLDKLYKIMESEWWTRRWIIQEAVLAKELTFLRGVEVSSWDHFQSWFENMRLKPPRRELENEYVSRGHPLFTLCSVFTDINSRRRESLSLTTALAECRGIYHATTRVDCVYALLGIATDADWIIPDYKKTLQDASIDIIVQNLAEGSLTASSLEFVSHCGSPDSESTEQSKTRFLRSHVQLPTWVPLWDRSMAGITRDNYQGLSVEVFHSVHGAPKPFVDANREVLHIRGVLLDTIQQFKRSRVRHHRLRACFASGTNLVSESMCPERTRVGDSICWIHFRQCLILRKHDDGWLIIGTGAVEGMKGSTDNQHRVLTTLPLKDFRIY